MSSCLRCQAVSEPFLTDLIFEHVSYALCFLFRILFTYFASTDTAAQLSVLCRRIKREGAGRVFICASHGLFSEKAMELIDLSPVERVVVTDSVPLPAKCSPKVVQVSIAPLLARVIETERSIRAHDFEEGVRVVAGKSTEDDDQYVMDD